MKKQTEYKKSLGVLEELNKAYPDVGIAMHLSRALADYGDFEGVTDREFLWALQKYQTICEQDLDTPQDIYRIIKDGENLFENIEDDEDY